MKWLASCLLILACSVSSNRVEADGHYFVNDVKYGSVFVNDYAMRAYRGTFNMNTGMVSWQEVTPQDANVMYYLATIMPMGPYTTVAVYETKAKFTYTTANKPQLFKAECYNATTGAFLGTINSTWVED